MSSRINAARFGALLSALACLVVAGCASQVMKSYVGQPIESAIADYGPPVNSFALDDGRRAFQWRQVQTSVVPGQTRVEVRDTRHGERYQATTTPGHVESRECFYTLYARSIDGRWIVNDFRQPTLLCE
ncbi:hypothetical protein [Bradyrhizobium prioriisuperbiae]|uniref:hypothetical protein n=1 Tax=Bradyrhizobium prioriisuperbiae TaxID=2854389 RepID=UPI0028E552F6|nr:hypothetical protein [Bradyrhizobium prioritasuperba]